MAQLATPKIAGDWLDLPRPRRSAAVLIPSRQCGPGRTLEPVSVLDQWSDEVLIRPRRVAAQPVLAELIQQLRDCASVKDSDEKAW